ncbi:cellulose synthase-like protein G3 [Tanacetum coccineum]
MKVKVEEVVASGNVYPDEKWTHVFKLWDAKFKRADHPSVIQVLLDGTIDDDVLGHAMPNLIYVSREKRKDTPHHFKGGALNVLLRVSRVMTNAPIILVVDCDMYSNDPKTPVEALCYFLDPLRDSNSLAYVQYPQLFHGISQDDLYGAEFKFVFQINMAGFDGLAGPSHVGTGCFFKRQAFYGSSSSHTFEQSRRQSIQSNEVLAQAHEVASSNFETGTKWGSELGYRYGSLVEDFYTGYRLQCLGWKSIFVFPKRQAFLGNAPMNLYDLLNQTQRWSIVWPIWCIPIIIYSFLPQLALIHSFPIFPKVSNLWFSLYTFSFIGAYIQDYFEFKLREGTTRGWFNNQRVWIIRGLSSYPFGMIEYMLTKLHISALTFVVTSKVVDKEASKRYDQGMMEFGVESPLFYPIVVAALVNLLAFTYGIVQIITYGGLDDLFVQLFLSGFGVVNSWPIYEAMFIRSDGGKMPLKITIRSIGLAIILYLASPIVF